MAEMEMLQNLVELARSATGATLAELTIALPTSDVSAATIDGDGGGITRFVAREAGAEHLVEDDGFPQLQGWAGASATAPVTGPSGGAGWLAVAHPDPNGLTGFAEVSLARIVLLVEDRLDRALERDRMAEIADVLRVDQEDLLVVCNQLKESNTDLGRFARIAANEFVAPIRALQSSANELHLLEIQGPEAASARHCISEIRQGVALLDSQLGHLLDLASLASEAAPAEQLTEAG